MKHGCQICSGSRTSPYQHRHLATSGAVRVDGELHVAANTYCKGGVDAQKLLDEVQEEFEQLGLPLQVHLPTSLGPLAQAKPTRPGSLSSSRQAWRSNSFRPLGAKQGRQRPNTMARVEMLTICSCHACVCVPVCAGLSPSPLALGTLHDLDKPEAGLAKEFQTGAWA